MLAKLSTELCEVFGCIRFAGNKEEFDAYILQHPRFREMSFEAVQAINSCTHANLMIKQTGEKIDMCQAIIDMKKESYDNGFQKGEKDAKISIVQRMLNAQYDLQEISKLTGLTILEINKIKVAQA